MQLPGGQNQPMEAVEAWDLWPEHNPAVQNININEAPQNGLGLDLNAFPDQQEMIIDPLFPPVQVEEVEPEPLDQVNEAEEEAEVEEVIMNDIADIQQGAQEAAQEVEVIMPDQYVPMMPLEIQEEDLMNNAEIQEQAAMTANQPANIFIGRIQILERPPFQLFS
jgi:hypothetical protein